MQSKQNRSHAEARARFFAVSLCMMAVALCYSATGPGCASPNLNHYGVWGEVSSEISTNTVKSNDLKARPIQIYYPASEKFSPAPPSGIVSFQSDDPNPELPPGVSLESFSTSASLVPGSLEKDGPLLLLSPVENKLTNADRLGENRKKMDRSLVYMANTKSFPNNLKRERSIRLIHARELLGNYYPISIVRKSEGVKNIENFIYRVVEHNLRPKMKPHARRLAQAIVKESVKYRFDPMFLMAMIQNESSFNTEIVGGVGEIGLLQLRPETAAYIAKRAGIPWKGKDSLFDPVSNVQYGAAYVAYLREKFDSKALLYISAYNMGATNVHNALAKKVWPKEYSSRTIARYLKFYADLNQFLKMNRKDLQASPTRIATAGKLRKKL